MFNTAPPVRRSGHTIASSIVERKTGLSMHMYELTERAENLALYGLPPKIEREFLQMLVDNPGLLAVIPQDLQLMVMNALERGECRPNG